MNGVQAREDESRGSDLTVFVQSSQDIGLLKLLSGDLDHVLGDFVVLVSDRESIGGRSEPGVEHVKQIVEVQVTHALPEVSVSGGASVVHLTDKEAHDGELTEEGSVVDLKLDIVNLWALGRLGVLGDRSGGLECSGQVADGEGRDVDLVVGDL